LIVKLISADFNAMTEAGHVRLTLPCSQEGIQRLVLCVGDWAWLSDGELVAGAQLAIDDRYGLVGVLDWDTLVHLDDEGADDPERVRAELNPLITRETSPDEDEPRVFQLLTQLEHAAPLSFGDTARAFFEFRRALALRNMHKLGLALLEMKEARESRPGDPEFAFVYLDLLRLEDLPSAIAEAETIAELPSVPAVVLSACINILAAQAEQMAAEQFESIAERVLALCRRLDQAPDRDQAGPSLVALSYFNRGIVHLRAGRISQARGAFENAQRVYPVGPMRDQLAGLETYDHHAREVARIVRAIAGSWAPAKTVAA
jgi:tetratricopeptide (TPR) repeat protein